MRKVIMIGEEPKEESKGVEFTHELDDEGYSHTCHKPDEFNKVVYLGNCDAAGDMFAAYNDSYIYIYKGNLNNGTY